MTVVRQKLRGVVAKKNMFLKAGALVVIFGPVALLWIGANYGILSDREWAIGGLAWAATLPVLMAIVRKWVAKNNVASGSVFGITVDDSRGRILRGIWLTKVWIGVLALLLPFGVANGVAHRAWLPTLGGTGISLSLMYLAIREIKRREERINLSRQ
jgi:hypothetical protein